ncbi:lipid IV(A) 4-amino-4-deoxy-L-arabinosyltransferase [Ewingella americana]|uniref:Undecaprenyl phosphate-alpha-4-amino-4-deoxy-L-arabinose arabinosyl transferase n=1 Tax=Ewingella americana TaxID=41202 RepID=A0A502GTY2_9GAMM|nr:lipid IV(A) 4-amino-4-deoxy-L-arabinosyltransferase [Ewingella americana]TPG64878.1 lipid IV(A) 4-amino-4-deoxy-L-arabinosyltransferase [Ewingella americana]
MFVFLKRINIFILGLLYALLYLLPLNGRLLWQPDETRYAEISREMLQRGDWVVPHLLGLRYFEKPVAGYWINNISQWLLGDNNFAVRFGSVFCTAVSAALIFWLGLKLWQNRSTAALATMVYLTSMLVFSVGTYSVLDPMISLWLTASMVASCLSLQATTRWKKCFWYALLGLACGMGFMTKGFLALLIPAIAMVPAVVQQRKVKELICFGPVAVLFALLLSLPWVIAIALREPDFWNYFFWVEHIQRFASDNAQHKSPFWFYLPLLCVGVLPWLALFPHALLRGWRERAMRPELFFLLCWVIMPLLFFSLAKGKLLTYILPCMAPISLLIAAYAKERVAQMSRRVFKVNGYINLLFGLTGALAICLFGWGLFPHAVIYGPQEYSKTVLAALAFVAWAMIGFITLREDARYWPFAAACPLLLALSIGYIIPQQIVDINQPQNFIANNENMLSESQTVLSNNVGIATGLAWELKRSDIIMYDAKGEMKYGLSYPESRSHFVKRDDFPAWLAEARKQGNISLVIQLPGNDELPDNLPAADKVIRSGRMALFWYQKS